MIKIKYYPLCRPDQIPNLSHIIKVELELALAYYQPQETHVPK